MIPIYVVYVLHSMYSDSYEWDRQNFINEDSALLYKEFLERNNENELKDENVSVKFETIYVITA